MDELITLKLRDMERILTDANKTLYHMDRANIQMAKMHAEDTIARVHQQLMRYAKDQAEQASEDRGEHIEPRHYKRYSSSREGTV